MRDLFVQVCMRLVSSFHLCMVKEITTLIIIIFWIKLLITVAIFILRCFDVLTHLHKLFGTLMHGRKAWESHLKTFLTRIKYINIESFLLTIVYFKRKQKWTPNLSNRWSEWWWVITFKQWWSQDFYQVEKRQWINNVSGTIYESLSS